MIAYYNFNYYNKMSSNKWINFLDHRFYSEIKIENFEKNVHEEKYENKFNIFGGKIIFPNMTLSVFQP